MKVPVAGAADFVEEADFFMVGFVGVGAAGMVVPVW
jgi:hypothetical protein